MSESSPGESPAAEGRARPSLAARIPAGGTRDVDRILGLFLDWVADIGLEPYPAQEEALLEVMSDRHVILGTPTGSGKTLVATALHFRAMCEGERSFYAAPIKALTSEKFFALCEDFGPEAVGMLTGDASINHEAPIICCTTEVLANMALRQGAALPVRYVGPGRVPLLRGPRARRRVADPAHRAARRPLPADVGDARQHRGHRGAPARVHRSRRRTRLRRRTPGSAGFRVPRDAAPRNHRAICCGAGSLPSTSSASPSGNAPSGPRGSPARRSRVGRRSPASPMRWRNSASTRPTARS